MQKTHIIRRLITGYLVTVGLLAHVVIIFAVVFAIKHFQLTPSQFLVKAVEKSPIDMPWIADAMLPTPRFASHALDGQLRVTHPRILLPELSGWSGRGMPDLVSKRLALYEKQGIQDFDPCGVSRKVKVMAACWVSSGDEHVALLLISALKDFKLQTPNVNGQYGNGWEMAFAYDLIANYKGLKQDDRALIEAKIEQALRDYLRLLDDYSPSLWHGRTSLASMAWLTAITLEINANQQRLKLVSQAQGHFLDVIRALELTEGWPEGYNYWIQNRGLVVSLAASAYINGLDNAQHTARILAVLKRVGFWHIYATRPDNRIENLGDEGSRVDLKDETRRVIDVIAQTTRNPVLASYSKYLQQLHGAASYYSAYRWGLRLFNDPTINSWPTSSTSNETEKNVASLTRFNAQLPHADLFGRGGLNQAYIRSDWSPSATFISFRAGHIFTHHGHYDAGHFTIYKGAPLAINSSINGDYKGDNRLNYSIRTVAKNSLLILRPDEKVQPNKFFQNNVADGGQRVIFPTGSAVQSVADWAGKLDNGKHLAGGRINHYQAVYGEYVYISSDLTKAYNTANHDEGGRGGKVREVKRDLLYLANEDRVLIHDQIVSTEASYTKKWLLHSVNQPRVANARVLKGVSTNGISETQESVVYIQNESGHLRVDRLYPEDAKIRLVGGIDYQFYVESDGDDTTLDGENFSAGALLHPWFDVGLWRIEIQPGAPRIEDAFLVALSPSLDAPRSDAPKPLLIKGAAAKGVETEKNIVVFVKASAHGEFEIVTTGNNQTQRKLYVFGIPVGMQARISSGSESQTTTVNSEGVLQVSSKMAVSQINVKW